MSQNRTAEGQHARVAAAFSACFLVIVAAVFSGQMWMRAAIREGAELDRFAALARGQATLASRLSAALATGGGPELAEMADSFARGHVALTGRAASSAFPEGAHELTEEATALLDAATRTLKGAPPDAEEAARLHRDVETRLLPRLAEAAARLTAERRARAATAERRGALANYVGILCLAGMGLFLHRPLLGRMRALGEAREAVEAELDRSRFSDSLTGLSNRRAMRARLAEAFVPAATAGRGATLLHFDLVGFRALAQQLGDAASDAAIRKVARIIREDARPEDFCARVGPDEFCLLICGALSVEDVEARARRLLARVAEPFDLDGRRVELAAVAAAVRVDAATGDLQSTLGDVEIALAEAKEDGPGAFRMGTPELRAAHQARNRLRAELAAALDEDQIEAWFQPQIRLSDGAVEGVEALARWRHPERGVLSPAAFLYTAAEFGLSDRFDERVMEKALDALASWRAAGTAPAHVAVNFAAEQLADPFMIEKIRWAVDQRGLAPGDLRIEILESVLMEECDEDTILNIQSLARSGFGVDLDDFGTGHASIASLRHLRVDRIKIDRGFIRHIDREPSQQTIVSAMVSLARAFGAGVVAEGVETAAELATARRLGCDAAQGFFIARPMEAAEFANWLAERETPRLIEDRGAAAG